MLEVDPLFRYHLQDIIIGKVYFLLVRIKIKHMELNIIRREQAGSGESSAMRNTSFPPLVRN